MHAFTNKDLSYGIQLRLIELILIRNFGLRTISVRARVFKSRQLPASGFRKKCSPFASLLLSLCLSLVSIQESSRMETRSLSPGARGGRFRGESHD